MVFLRDLPFLPHLEFDSAQNEWNNHDELLNPNKKKIFFSGTKRPMTLKLGMRHWLLEFYQKGKQKSRGRDTSRSRSQPLTSGGREKVTQINMCIANKQMHDKHKAQICSNDDPGLTLTYFTARSNLVPFVFVGKCLSRRFPRNYWILWEVGTYCQINEYMAIYDNPRSM